MIHARLRRLPRLASLCTAGALLLPVGCILPMTQLSQEALAAPGPMPGDWKLRLPHLSTPSTSENSTAGANRLSPSMVLRAAYHAGEPVAAIAPAFACIDFTCDSSCCVHELVLQKAQAPAILSPIAVSPESVSILPLSELTAAISETIVPTARPPLRI